MKSIFKILIVIIMVLTFNVKAVTLPKETNHEKVVMYVFYGKGCHACHGLIEYYLENYKDEYKNYFEIMFYETYDSKDNRSLGVQVRHELEIERMGVPFIVIGDKTQVGFATSIGEDLINLALEEYQNDNYKDIVKEIITTNKFSVNLENLSEAAVTSGIIEGSEDTPTNGENKDEDVDKELEVKKEEDANLNDDKDEILNYLVPIGGALAIVIIGVIALRVAKIKI